MANEASTNWAKYTPLLFVKCQEQILTHLSFDVVSQNLNCECIVMRASAFTVDDLHQTNYVSLWETLSITNKLLELSRAVSGTDPRVGLFSLPHALHLQSHVPFTCFGLGVNGCLLRTCGQVSNHGQCRMAHSNERVLST